MWQRYFVLLLFLLFFFDEGEKFSAPASSSARDPKDATPVISLRLFIQCLFDEERYSLAARVQEHVDHRVRCDVTLDYEQKKRRISARIFCLCFFLYFFFYFSWQGCGSELQRASRSAEHLLCTQASSPYYCHFLKPLFLFATRIPT